MTITTSNAHVMRPRLAAVTAVLAGLTLSLAGCGGGSDSVEASDEGGGGLDGEYYSVDIGSDAGRLTIDGSTLTFTNFECADGGGVQFQEDDWATSSAQITDDQSQVIWASDDEHLEDESMGGTTAMSASTAGDTKTISIENHEFRTGKTEEQAMAAYAEEIC